MWGLTSKPNVYSWCFMALSWERVRVRSCLLHLVTYAPTRSKTWLTKRVHQQKLVPVTEFKCFRADFSSNLGSRKQLVSLLSLLLPELHVSFSLPLPTEWGSTAAARSWGSAAGRRSPGLWVCGAVCTCCRAPPLLWPRDRCCGKTRSASSVHDHRSWSTASGQGRRSKKSVWSKNKKKKTDDASSIFNKRRFNDTLNHAL